MDERLSLDEIERRFPEKWVVIDDPHGVQSRSSFKGIVAFHSTSRSECYRGSARRQPGSLVYFTGTQARVRLINLELPILLDSEFRRQLRHDVKRLS